MLQRSARTTVEAGPRYHGLGLRNGPRTCVVPLMIFAVGGSCHLVGRRGVVTVLLVTVVILVIVTLVIPVIMPVVVMTLCPSC